MRPASSWSSTAAGSTSTTSPTRPRSSSLAVDDDAATAPPEQAGVLTGETGGERAVLVDLADELAVDLAGEHHPHDVHRLGGGDAVAALELARDAEPVEHRRDLRAAAVHDDGPDADVAQVDHVLGEGALQLVADHGVAAVLDHDDLVVEALQPRQRLDEGRGLGPRRCAISGSVSSSVIVSS